MMETKLWIALCALLLINLGSADHQDGDHTTASSALGSKAAPEAPAEGSVPTSSMDLISHAAATAPPLNGPDANPGSRVTSSLSNDTTTERETSPLTPESKNNNGTNNVSPTGAVVPETSRKLPDQSTTQPPIPPSGSQAPTSLISTTTSPAHTAHSAPVDKAATVPPTNASSDAAVPLPDSTPPSTQPTHSKTHSSASVPTSEPPKPEITIITTTTIAQPSSTSSTSSSQEPPKSESPTVTSPQKTSRPNGHPESSTAPHPKSATSSPSAQANAQSDTLSQLTVGGDTTMVHESPTLDPLLAGLVSAFIITAVIITLLLFLKLRRRDNRPEFRRLQDLPMDDMMEDTPLSMYSY